MPSEHKYFFGSIVITDKIDSLADDANQSMPQERRVIMDQLRTLEFVQLQAFARVLQQQNKKYVRAEMIFDRRMPSLKIAIHHR